MPPNYDDLDDGEGPSTLTGSCRTMEEISGANHYRPSARSHLARECKDDASSIPEYYCVGPCLARAEMYSCRRETLNPEGAAAPNMPVLFIAR